MLCVVGGFPVLAPTTRMGSDGEDDAVFDCLAELWQATKVVQWLVAEAAEAAPEAGYHDYHEILPLPPPSPDKRPQRLAIPTAGDANTPTGSQDNDDDNGND